MSNNKAPGPTSNDRNTPPTPLSPEEIVRLDHRIGEEARRQAEVGQTVRGKGG